MPPPGNPGMQAASAAQQQGSLLSSLQYSGSAGGDSGGSREHKEFPKSLLFACPPLSAFSECEGVSFLNHMFGNFEGTMSYIVSITDSPRANALPSMMFFKEQAFLYLAIPYIRVRESWSPWDMFFSFETAGGISSPYDDGDMMQGAYNSAYSGGGDMGGYDVDMSSVGQLSPSPTPGHSRGYSYDYAHDDSLYM